jgi:hypothetical protein
VFGQETLTKTLFKRENPSIKQGLLVNKKRLLTVAFISVLVLPAAGRTQVVNLAQAISDSIVIESPKNNTVYSSAILLNYSITSSSTYPDSYNQKWVAWIGYNIDDKPAVTITPPVTITEQSVPVLPLSDLPNGEHRISVIVQFAYTTSIGAYTYNVSSAPVYFRVDVTPSIRIDSSPPNIFIQSPENKTCNTADISLNFTVDEPVILMGYRLDAQDYVTTAGNTTLTDLPHGSHNLTVYAYDTAGNIGASEAVYFTISQETEPQQEPFPTTLVVASVVTVAVIGLVMLVYFKKRKR